MMAGMKRLYEEQKKFQASTEKIEKMIEEMQHGVGRAVSSKMQISCDLSRSQVAIEAIYCRLWFMKSIPKLWIMGKNGTSL